MHRGGAEFAESGRNMRPPAKIQEVSLFLIYFGDVLRMMVILKYGLFSHKVRKERKVREKFEFINYISRNDNIIEKQQSTILCALWDLCKRILMEKIIFHFYLKKACICHIFIYNE
jgi:hypothetical protein